MCTNKTRAGAEKHGSGEKLLAGALSTIDFVFARGIFAGLTRNSPAGNFSESFITQCLPMAK